MSDQNELVLFQTADEKVKLSVPINGETVWLNRNQIADLFDRDIKTIGKHINNSISDELAGLCLGVYKDTGSKICFLPLPSVGMIPPVSVFRLPINLRLALGCFLSLSQLR